MRKRMNRNTEYYSIIKEKLIADTSFERQGTVIRERNKYTTYNKLEKFTTYGENIQYGNPSYQ